MAGAGAYTYNEPGRTWYMSINTISDITFLPHSGGIGKNDADISFSLPFAGHSRPHIVDFDASSFHEHDLLAASSLSRRLRSAGRKRKVEHLAGRRRSWLRGGRHCDSARYWRQATAAMAGRSMAASATVRQRRWPSYPDSVSALI